jgi:hypothetical protein
MISPTAERIQALEQRIVEITSAASACVRELLVDDGARLLVAERLPALGSATIPTIHELLAEDVPEEVRTLAALVGVTVGDMGPSVEQLLQEIEEGGEFTILAARCLVAQHIPGVASVILKGIESCSADDVDRVVALLEALRDSGERLPESERKRLTLSGHWQISTAISAWFPAPPNS